MTPPAPARLTEGMFVLVTGAASGIGQATAELFAVEGAAGVLLADLDASGLDDTAARVRAAGADVDVAAVDVTDEPAVAAMVAQAVQRFGRLDAAFNNAGITGPGAAFDQVRLEDWNHVLAVDLTAVFLCMKHELRVMAAQGSGAIVNTSSGAGIIGFPGLPHYVAAKHGVLGLTKTAALEYAGRGVRVNAICPGVTDTPMVRRSIGGNAEVEAARRATLPGGQFGRPEEVAAAAVWLASPRASFVNGESMAVDGASVCR